MWFRRDLRLTDHQALSAAANTGRPIIPVFICDEVMENLGAAPKWRFGLGVNHFQETLQNIGSRLILRRGNALAVLQKLIAQTGATSVYWSRAYDPESVERDTKIKAELIDRDITVNSFEGSLLVEPWVPKTKNWRAIQGVYAILEKHIFKFAR